MAGFRTGCGARDSTGVYIFPAAFHCATSVPPRPFIQSSTAVKVAGAGRYAVTWQMQSETVGSFVFPVVIAVDSSGGSPRTHLGTYCANSAAGIWEEGSMSFDLGPEERSVYIQLERGKQEIADMSGAIRLKDVRLQAGIPIRPRASKVAFDGEVAIDTLGNWSIGGRPFFPIAIYGTHRRTDFTIYKTLGFNTMMRSGYPWGGMEAAHAAGLYHVLDLTAFIMGCVDSAATVEQVSTFRSWLSSVRAFAPGGASIWPSVIAYYWDNETWDIKRSQLDVFAAAVPRDRPLYILQGASGLGRAYPWGDVTGTYVNGQAAAASAQGPAGMILLDHISKVPVSFAQINDQSIRGLPALNADELVVQAYQGILAGARAIGVFADFYYPDVPGSGLENAPWSSAMPGLAKEIEALLPVLRTPTGTVWTDPPLEFALRQEPSGRRWLFVVNPSERPAAFDLPSRGTNYRTREQRERRAEISVAPRSTQIWSVED